MGNAKHGDRKKVSWMYRKKAKERRAKGQPSDVGDNVQVQNKKARIIIRNLPFKATEEDVNRFYESFGPIEEINLLKHPDGKPVGCGFIQFKRIEDASKAIFKTNKQDFLGRPISTSWAIPKSKFCQKLEKEPSGENVDTSENTNEDNQENDNEDEVKNEEAEVKDEPQETKDTLKKAKSKSFKEQDRKLQKDKNRKKRARIVVRNISFQATENDLKEHFKQYGTIEDIKILTRSDGKNVGCAFVQFERVQSAAQAIHYANLNPLLGRPIVLDWALPKNTFSKKDANDTTEIKEEVVSDDDKDESKVNQSNVEIGSDDEDADTNSEGIESDTDDLDVKDEMKDEDESLDEENSIKDEKGSIMEMDGEDEEMERKRPRYESHDVTEGKTIFLKNVPFSVRNEDLKRYMEKFGPVFYALVCIDPLTEHSKGTAFVKFRNVEDAEKCLAAGNELKMQDEILEAHRALDRKEVENKAMSKHQKDRDSRNLYLVKEGVIMAGSPAAAGVSAADMAKRLQIEQWKSQILRNLNMFVSRVRLVVHNLPPTLDDTKLRQIFQRHSGPNAIIKEARVMRDLKSVDAKGVGKSKEYGFVSFTNHEDALKVLRSVNNNPNVFHKNKRPIISFSIENRIMVNAKQKRIEKSREHNPLWSGKGDKRPNDERFNKFPAKRQKVEKTNEADEIPYAGMVGKPGENKMRSRFKLRTQAAIHSQAVKKEKKKMKSAKKQVIQKKNDAKSKNEVKPKQGMKVNSDDVNLDKLVNNYKNKLQNIKLTKSKWFDT